jgi:hypothetical protein
VHTFFQKKKRSDSKSSSLEILDDAALGEGSSTKSRVYTVNDVQVDRMLAEGRFAVVSRGLLVQNYDCTPIAVKTLRSTYHLFLHVP